MGAAHHLIVRPTAISGVKEGTRGADLMMYSGNVRAEEPGLQLAFATWVLGVSCRSAEAEVTTLSMDGRTASTTCLHRHSSDLCSSGNLYFVREDYVRGHSIVESTVGDRTGEGTRPPTYTDRGWNVFEMEKEMDLGI